MTDLESLCDDILQQMYEEAEPGLDFSDLKENPDDYPDDWYSQHYLSDERQHEIIEEYTDGENLTEQEEAAVTMTCILDMGPSSSDEA